MKSLLGVLVSKKRIQSILQQKPYDRYQELEKASREVDITLCFFSGQDVDYKQNKIKGAFFDKQKNRWRQEYFPFPHVIYRKTGGLHRKKRKRLRNKINQLGIPSVNYLIGFNKYKVYQHLYNDKAIRPFLPETASSRNFKVLLKMLQRYQTVYVKALRGGRGKQVIRVRKKHSGEYEYRYFVKKLTRRTVPSSKQLIKAIKRFIGTGGVIVQQAIDLPVIDRKIVDLRAEVQRNGSGELEVIAISVRMGKKNSPITTHATSLPFEDFYAQFLHYNDNRIVSLRNKAEGFVKKVYRSIEKKCGPCGEMGIDFAIDQNDRLWFIECNSRSTKVSLLKAYHKNVMQRSNRNVLEYARFIATKGSAAS